MKLTAAEWQIMNALWAEHPASARQIAGQLPSGVSWAYTTIKTMLTRLVEKKAVSEHKDGNISIYQPVLSRDKARRGALRALANQAFDGAFGPLMHFLLEEQVLSDNQRAELIDMLENDSRNKENEK